jgi:hypothetical protein
VSDPLALWSTLSRAWKGASITFFPPIFALMSAGVWAGGVASYLRIQDRRRDDR